MIKKINKKYSSTYNKIIILLFYLLIGIAFLHLPTLLSLFFKEEKTISVYAYADFITTECVEEFEKETGIKVRLKYFDNDNELLAKFEIDKGEGYDLITASDYAIELLIKKDILKKIDHSKIPNSTELDKKLLGHYFDPENQYGLPYFWSIYGIMFKKSILKKDIKEIGWDFVFQNPEKQLISGTNNKIAMLDNPTESIFFTAIYLFGNVKNLTDTKLEKIKEVLTQQKKWVEIYTSGSLQYYLLANVVNIAVASTAFTKKILDISDEYEFVIPQEGSILVIDLLTIPKLSKKADFAYQFINFLLSKKISAMNSKEYGYNPANKLAQEEIDEKFTKNKAFFPDQKTFKKLHLMHNEVDPKKIEDLWLSVRVF